MNRLLIYFFVLSSVNNLCYGDDIFPNIPERHLPLIRTIPTQEGIILETRGAPINGDPIPSQDGTHQIEVGVFNLSNNSESDWDLPSNILKIDMTAYYNYSDKIASWASKSGQLILASHDSINLINRDGSYTKPNIKISRQYSDDSDSLAYRAISQDSQYIAYYKIHTGLMYQKLDGSEPISIPILQGGAYPDWSPDNTMLAFADKFKILVVSDLKGRVIFSIDPPFKETNAPQHADFAIEEIRWSPRGDKIGFIVYESYWKVQNAIEKQFFIPSQTIRESFYTINTDGTSLERIKVGNNDIDVNTFAWSPSGMKIAFRSDYDKQKICGHNLSFLIEASHLPCRDGYYLYTSNTDGSDVKRISKEPEYRKSELFWIQ